MSLGKPEHLSYKNDTIDPEIKELINKSASLPRPIINQLLSKYL